MIKPLFTSLTLVASAMCVSPLSAQSASIFECALKKAKLGEWISPNYAIAYNSETNEAFVSDPLILATNEKKPISVEIVSNSSKKITFRWEIAHTKSGSGQNVPRFVYRATILKPSNGFVVTAKPLHYANSFRRSGSCTLKQS